MTIVNLRRAESKIAPTRTKDGWKEILLGTFRSISEDRVLAELPALPSTACWPFPGYRRHRFTLRVVRRRREHPGQPGSNIQHPPGWCDRNHK